MRWISSEQTLRFKKAQIFMARQAEPFVVLLTRTVRMRWKLLVTCMISCLLLIMLIISLLPSRYMAVGLVRVGFVGPGFGMLSLNTIATEAGSTGFIERVRNEVGAPGAEMVARVRFSSNLIELRAYAATEEQAVSMVKMAGGWMVKEHHQIIDQVFAGAKALYLERFGQAPKTEELVFQRNSLALEVLEEVRDVKPGILPTTLLSLFLGLFLGIVVIVFREILDQNEPS
jgi:hypothetical protein